MDFEGTLKKMEQPDIIEPTPVLGAIVFYSETGDLSGKIIKVSDQKVVIDFGTKISSYPISDIRVQCFYGHLVLVAGKNERIVHVYI